jgi:hypothetical protein
MVIQTDELKFGRTNDDGMTYVGRDFSRANSAFYQRISFNAGYSARNFS